MPQSATVTTGTGIETVEPGQGIKHGANRVTTADQDSGRISVDLFGGLRVRAGGRLIGPRELGGTKPRHVLLALLLHRGAPVSKDRLISVLWGASPPSCATATLEGYVCVLRKKLHPAQTVRASLISTVAGHYAIDMGRVDLDLVRYEHLVSAALDPATSPADALPMLQQAMSLTESPLLPEEIDSEWLDDARAIHSENVRKNLISAANKVAGLPLGSSERWARLALQSDPLDESAWYALLAGMEANGQHAGGLQAYDQCRRLFATELGCAPGPALQGVYTRLLRGANEDNEELSHLLDSVVRLHMASQLGSSPPATALGSAISDEVNDEISHNTSLEQAFRSLNLLLRSVRSPRSNLAGALGA